MSRLPFLTTWDIQSHCTMAIWQRKPPKGLIWHTDRDSQYSSHSHRKLLKAHGIKQSMSRKGNCWDNASSESFFHSLKTECTYHLSFKTRKEAKQAIFEYIQVFYNRKRLHSTNNYLSPNDHEVMMNAAYFFVQKRLATSVITG